MPSPVPRLGIDENAKITAAQSDDRQPDAASDDRSSRPMLVSRRTTGERKGNPVQVRDGPAAVRGDAPAPHATGPRAGKAAREGAPSQKTCRRRQTRTPRGRRIRAPPLSRLRRRGARRSRSSCRRGARAHASRARRRQDADDLRRARRRASTPANALEALEARQPAPASSTTTSRTTSFGPYVDQVGRYPAGGQTGWVFKVNGVSPPVGADEVELKDGDTVLWYWAQFGVAGGPKTLVLQRARRRGCYRVSQQDDAGRERRRRAARCSASTAAASPTRDGRALRRPAHGSRPRDRSPARSARTPFA